MTSFQPCPSCARHVKRQDARCPFCGVPCPRRPMHARTSRRTSRAQWLALGSTMALLGCSGGTASSGSGDAGGRDLAHASEAGGDDVAACPTRSGYFTCGGNVCDRSIQVCVERSSLCVSVDALGPIATGSPVQCGACPTCECLQPSILSSCQCQQDDAGTISISCGGCYGAPPARLERLTRRSTTQRRR
jgi:hypothetical protein